MKIAIQSADLSFDRIDGTRVYLKNLLERFGKIAPEDLFFLYYQRPFNPHLAPPDFKNYFRRQSKFPFFWTQTALAQSLWRDKPERLWMPVHNLPLFHRQSLQIVTTIHDLAFKYFPDHFPSRMRWKLNCLVKLAIERADRLIAVSQSTKKDILKFFPKVPEEKIRVIYHGCNWRSQPCPENQEKFGPEKVFRTGDCYFLYVGAIQPRKNLETLVRAFEIYRNLDSRRCRLVLAGEKAWLWQKTLDVIENSPCRRDIILTGILSFDEIACLYQKASLFVFPSLYEGFGLPVLEAMSAGVPVICANNSSLPEVAGEAACYFSQNSAEELAFQIKKVMDDEELRRNLVGKGYKQAQKFSWTRCAEQTLSWIKS